MKTILIAIALLTTASTAFAGQGDSYSAGDGQAFISSRWNGLYGTKAFAWHEQNLSYSVSRSRAGLLANQHEIDKTHKAKTGKQYPGGYADNGLHGKGKTTHETGGPRGNVDHR